MTTGSATDRKNRPSEALLPEVGLLYSAGFALCLKRGNLHLHLPNQFCQLRLTLGFRSGVDVPCHALAVDLGGVAPFPQVVVDLGDTPGAPLAVFALDWSEICCQRETEVIIQILRSTLISKSTKLYF